MVNRRIGKLTPRYFFILNRYPDERISKCPLCQRQTHLRKFPLFIHIDDWGPIILGKTCKYCARCELIVVHQHELEAEMAHSFSQLAPEVVGNEYLVIGTVEKKVWQQGLKGSESQLQESLQHTADFKKVYDLHVEPGGWYPADHREAKR